MRTQCMEMEMTPPVDVKATGQNKKSLMPMTWNAASTSVHKHSKPYSLTFMQTLQHIY